MSRHVNIPIFIPHLGCPNQCVFCNQRTISGVKEFDVSSVKATIDTALETVETDAEVEIAFFGGSFTGIDYNLMVDLLSIAYSYVEAGRVQSIRCSTRPDYIDERILATLRRYGVKEIELGLQSICPEVLSASKRGHTVRAAQEACRLITEGGFSLTGQMMIGLPESGEEQELETARFIVSSGCKSARIYPTVVFKDTELCGMAQTGIYSPLTVDEAVRRSAKALDVLINGGVKVIRIGLCASDNLLSDETYYAGPNHPAIGEMVESRLIYDRIMKKALGMHLEKNDTLVVTVAKGSLSKAVGQRKINKLSIKQELGISDVKFAESEELLEYDFLLNVENGENKCT